MVCRRQKFEWKNSDLCFCTNAQNAPSVGSVVISSVFRFTVTPFFAGLAPVDTTPDEHRALKLQGLIRRIEARQEIRGRYANLLGTVVFFCVYITMIYLQKGNIEQSSMIQVPFN